MKGQFTGKVNGDIDLDESGAAPFLIINNQPISLTACAAVSPTMLAVLEELAKPESDGGVFRLERDGDTVRLTKTGVLAHVVNKLAAALPRQRVRARA